MARDILYRQCQLERQGDAGIIQTVTWIPESKKGIKIAPGVRVTLKDYGTNEDLPGLWTVKMVSEVTMTEARVSQRAHDWTKHREFSDV